jgi:hypothetical protein
MAKMGRPVKDNADFFSHDANASDDIKIKALENRMGIEGYAIYFKVLEILTKSSRFQLDISKAYIREGIAQSLKISSELFENFVKNAIEVELLFEDKEGFLFSKGLKKRLQVLVKYRRYDRDRRKTFHTGKVPEKSVKSSSKVKESKVKESKDIYIEPELSLIPDEENSNREKQVEFREVKHPLLIWVEENARRVLEMKEPLTSAECERLIKDYPEEKIRDKLSAMHNKINLTKKYHSANLTVRNWLKMSNVAKLNSNGNDQLEGKTITLRRA